MKKLIFLFIVLLTVPNIIAQKADKKSRKEIKAEKKVLLKEKIQKIVDSKTFEFIPNTALPARGRSISISQFNLQLKNDTLTSYLPYYGRAYTADYGSTSSPLNFEGVIENYEKTRGKKNYNVQFNVKNKSDNLVYRFQIFDNGSTSLNVQSVNRQSISFNGYIEELK